MSPARAEAEAPVRADGPAGAARTYGEAVTLAGELEIHPLVAHCRLGLGVLYAREGERAQAAVELAAARELFGAMAMEVWAALAERAVAGLR